MTDTKSEPYGRTIERRTVRVIAGKSIEEWREFARRDDCLERMVPSDLRQLIGALRNE